MIEYLILSGAEVHAVNNSGVTSLTYAIQADQSEAVDMLVRYGAGG